MTTAQVEKILIGSLLVIWILHLVGVFTPEVGFDAVWYHLPVISQVIEAQSLIYLPELYQSVNPLFSDLIFGVGFIVGGELGAKFVAYLFALGLVALSYRVGRVFLSNRNWALTIALVVSSFQVVSWQASSFYVDVAKAFWELGSILLLVVWYKSGNKSRKRLLLIVSGLAFGASLATKLFSMFLWPVFIWGVWSLSKKDKLKNVLLFFVSSLLPPLPFYIFAYIKTGNPFYSFTFHLDKLSQIGGSGNIWVYLLNRTISLPSSIWVLLTARDYTSILLILFAPLVFLVRKRILKKPLLNFIVIFSLAQFLLWWYLPPLSTRYALSGFITWLVLVIFASKHLYHRYSNHRWSIIVTIILATTINLVPRVVVANRSIDYLIGRQSKQQYIESFYDGHLDTHLKKWHQLK